MANQEKDPDSRGMSRAALIALAVATIIGLGFLILQAALRLVMVFEAAG